MRTGADGAPQNYDILVLDVFSSDSIPVHLITKEALGVYLRHLQPDGIVAFHVSNRFLDLVPVVGRIAKENGAHAVVVYDLGGEDDDKTQSDWVLVSRDPRALERPAIRAAGATEAQDRDAKHVAGRQCSRVARAIAPGQRAFALQSAAVVQRADARRNRHDCLKGVLTAAPASRPPPPCGR